METYKNRSAAARSVVWLRRDLRLDDHVSLHAASQESDELAILFVFDTVILKKLEDRNDRRLTFIFDSLKELDSELRERGSQLFVYHGDPLEVVPKAARELGAQRVYTNRDYEPYAKQRDSGVSKRLAQIGVEFRSYKDQVIFEGLEIASGSGGPYKVFTAYRNKWLSEVSKENFSAKAWNTEKLLRGANARQDDWSLEKIGFERNQLWTPAGDQAAQKALRDFSQHINDYEQTRNFPALEHGTSGLSVHFRFGTLSIRHAFRTAFENRSKGAKTWISELIWREFFQMILDQYPETVDHAFRKEFDFIEWPGLDKHFEAWKEGQTGYPIVDAAMRCLYETGWMHNRLRMIVASFLTKDLLIDWKKGERWFARQLLDFDLASNVGGWQWAASTGCDAQPFFRVFNPLTQSKKFDEDGNFIRQWVPELRDVENRWIHEPSSSPTFERLGYPDPVVDHAKQRLKALRLYENASEKRKNLS